MTFLPIVDRELRATARRRSTYWTRFSAALVALFIGFWILLASQDAPPASVSQGLFTALAVLAFGVCLIAGVHQTADCLSEEKRGGTLGLLFLTDLKGYDVVLGKLAANSLNSVYALLAIFPVLALPLLLGGVEPGAFWRMVLHLVNTLFFSLAGGLFVSAISRDARRALVGASSLILLITAGLPLIGVLLREYALKWFPPEAWNLFFLPSPGYAFRLAAISAISPRIDLHLWQSLLTIHLLGWLFLAAATWILPRSWQDKPASVNTLRWREFWRRWAYGCPEKRKTFRTRLLDINPFYWLAGRFHAKRIWVWVFLGLVGAGWFWGYLKIRLDWLHVAVGITTAILLHTVLKIWLASEVCRLFSEQRQSGAWELLLSSPLSVPEILHGQMLALRLQFGGPLIAVLLADVFLLAIGLKHESGGFSNSDHTENALVFLIGMTVFVMDCYTLGWVGMWCGLSARKFNRATSATIAQVLVLPWCVFLGSLIAYFTLRLDKVYAPQSAMPVLFWWVVIAVINNVIFMGWARKKLNRDFRLVAAQQSLPRQSPGWWPFHRAKAAPLRPPAPAK